MNGARKTVQVVDSGIVHRKLIIALNTRDLSSNRLTVALALDGRVPEAECSAAWDGGAALQILPGSHLRLSMAGPVENPADLLRMSGKRPIVSWPAEDSAEQVRRFVQAYDLAQRTNDVTFAIDGSTTVDLSGDILDDVIAATALATVSDTVDPADLAASLGLQRTREFEGETRWRVTFARGDFEESIQAVQLDLALASITTADEPWLMVAELNDRLLTSAPIAVESGGLSQTIPLPQELQLDQNVLTISLRNSAATEDRCVNGVPAVAEVTTLSIVADGLKSQTPFAALS